MRPSLCYCCGKYIFLNKIIKFRTYFLRLTVGIEQLFNSDLVSVTKPRLGKELLINRYEHNYANSGAWTLHIRRSCVEAQTDTFRSFTQNSEENVLGRIMKKAKTYN